MVDGRATSALDEQRDADAGPWAVARCARLAAGARLDAARGVHADRRDGQQRLRRRWRRPGRPRG